MCLKLIEKMSSQNTTSRWNASITSGSAWWELLGSMRFSISLLTIISIASVIGTVIKQNEPFVNYVNQFGPFWAEFYKPMGLYEIYNTPWFLVVMAFLVMSTSVCVSRNAPKMLKEMKIFREHVRETSLRSFSHRWEGQLDGQSGELKGHVQEWLKFRGYSTKLDERDDGYMLAAKRGSANRLGYIAAHLAIIIICVGGLLDSGLPLSLMVWVTGKQALPSTSGVVQIPELSRLSSSNPSYRANLLLPEGESSKIALLSTKSGILIQDLPFEIKLKQFRIDFYSTGMPKLFASDVEVFDRESGQQFEQTIEVNKPLIYKGVTVYQSSFDDGGSKLRLVGRPVQGAKDYTFPVAGEVGGKTSLENNGKPYSVEFTGFKAINVENMSGEPSGQANALENHFKNNVANVFGSGASRDKTKQFKNIGPSVTYKIRDEAGQAREYQNYMVPVDIDGGRYYLTGVRSSPDESFRYLRIPVDDKDSVDEFFRLRVALESDKMIKLAAQRFADAAVQTMNLSSSGNDLKIRLAQSAEKALQTFAGDGQRSGLQSVAHFLETTVPEAEREKATEVFVKILQGSLWHMWQVSREQAGLKSPANDEKSGRFLQDAQLALSDLGLYGAPVMLQLDTFDEVKASVLQLAKAPGQWVVYLGCVLLIIGVFAMFYIRERRVWFWFAKNEGNSVGTHTLMAMSTPRKTMDFDKEFADICKTLQSKSVH